jgi:hypothetical protein
MSKTARLYQDTRTAGAGGGALDTLNNELQDVTRIMTKNMEELLWRGDSLDRTHFRISLPCEGLDMSCRDVPPLDLAPLRVGEVPKSGAEHQLPGHAPQIRAARRDRRALPHLRLVAVLLDDLLFFLAVHIVIVFGARGNIQSSR